MRRMFVLLITSLLLLVACSPPADVPTEAKEEDEIPSETNPETEGLTEKEIEDGDKIVGVKQSILDEIQEELDSKERYNKALTGEVEYYRAYVKRLSMKLSTEKLQELIDDEWTYSLTVNGVNFPQNGVLDISSEKIDIVASESRVPYTVLTDEQSIEGKVSGAFYKNISISGMQPTETDTNEAETDSRVTYSMSGTKKGETFTIKLKNGLHEKLGLQTDELTLNIK